MRGLLKNQTGFTLVEMIIVIVITGIIGGIVAVFIKAPVQGYVDSARRAELTDIADTALRRMARDIRSAVPNSVRFTNCAAPCVEFIPTKDGGRYRADAGGTGNVLNFGAADGSFEIIGSGIPFDGGEFIVVGSTQSDGSLPYSTAASGVLRASTLAAGTHTVVTMTNTVGLPTTAALDSQRFDVVDGTQQAVTYSCAVAGGGACATDANGNGTCQLTRRWSYGFAGAAGGSSAVLANNVSACVIDYEIPATPATAVFSRFGLVAVRLTLTQSNESVSLYNEIHVNNAP